MPKFRVTSSERRPDRESAQIVGCEPSDTAAMAGCEPTAMAGCEPASMAGCDAASGCEGGEAGPNTSPIALEPLLPLDD